jgi:hypothetical protein
MNSRKPSLKTQRELSQDSITTYQTENYKADKVNVNTLKGRAQQRSTKQDNVKDFSIGLKDIDETIFYYFNNVIKPSVIQNGVAKTVPIIYGSAERWSAVQKDGFYRDKNGKIQLPLIMVKRDSVEKNRQLGNKMDANNPNNFGVFEKKFSRKNVYDRFSTLNNRVETKEYHGVVIPDYVNLTYSCIIFTEYIEQMNKIVESINYASDAYWGDPEKFNFRAMIDSYNTTTELNQGEDRSVKTDFSIKLLGHIVPDSINALQMGSKKFFSKSSVTFTLETVDDINSLELINGEMRDTNNVPIVNNVTVEIPQAELEFINLMRAFSSNLKTVTVDTNNRTITWENLNIQPVPNPRLTAPTTADFQFYINGQLVEVDAISTIVDSGNNLVITMVSGDNLDFTLSETDEYIIIGKLYDPTL